MGVCVPALFVFVREAYISMVEPSAKSLDGLLTGRGDDGTNYSAPNEAGESALKKTPTGITGARRKVGRDPCPGF